MDTKNKPINLINRLPIYNITLTLAIGIYSLIFYKVCIGYNVFDYTFNNLILILFSVFTNSLYKKYIYKFKINKLSKLKNILNISNIRQHEELIVSIPISFLFIILLAFIDPITLNTISSCSPLTNCIIFILLDCMTNKNKRGKYIQNNNNNIYMWYIILIFSILLTVGGNYFLQNNTTNINMIGLYLMIFFLIIKGIIYFYIDVINKKTDGINTCFLFNNKIYNISNIVHKKYEKIDYYNELFTNTDISNIVHKKYKKIDYYNELFTNTDIFNKIKLIIMSNDYKLKKNNDNNLERNDNNLEGNDDTLKLSIFKYIYLSIYHKNIDKTKNIKDIIDKIKVLDGIVNNTNNIEEIIEKIKHLDIAINATPKFIQDIMNKYFDSNSIQIIQKIINKEVNIDTIKDIDIDIYYVCLLYDSIKNGEQNKNNADILINSLESNKFNCLINVKNNIIVDFNYFSFLYINMEALWISLLLIILLIIGYNTPKTTILPFIFSIIYGPLMSASYIETKKKEINTITLTWITNIVNIIVIGISYILNIITFKPINILWICFIIGGSMGGAISFNNILDIVNENADNNSENNNSENNNIKSSKIVPNSEG
jgi:hypothetical protein